MAVKKEHQNKSKWQRMTPEQKARRIETMRAWQKANPDRVAKYQAKAKAKAKHTTRKTGYGDFTRARKYDYVKDKKIERGSCVDCGFPCDDMTHVCFAWDHLNPTDKLFSLSKAHKYTWEQIDQEIAKCELVCHNCHALRTYLEGHNRTERQHSTNDQMTLFE